MQNICGLLFSTILLGASVVYSQSISLTGVVVDQTTGNPIANANVFLKANGGAATSNTDGSFSIQHLVPVAGRENPVPDVPFLSRDALHFSLPRSQRIQVEVFSLRGRRLKNLFDGELEAGNYSLKYPSDPVYRGLQIIRMRRSGHQHTFKYLPMASGKATLSREHFTDGVLRKGPPLPIPDTLVILAPQYNTYAEEITVLQANLGDIPLTAISGYDSLDALIDSLMAEADKQPVNVPLSNLLLTGEARLDSLIQSFPKGLDSMLFQEYGYELARRVADRNLKPLGTSDTLTFTEVLYQYLQTTNAQGVLPSGQRVSLAGTSLSQLRQQGIRVTTFTNLPTGLQSTIDGQVVGMNDYLLPDSLNSMAYDFFNDTLVLDDTRLLHKRGVAPINIQPAKLFLASPTPGMVRATKLATGLSMLSSVATIGFGIYNTIQAEEQTQLLQGISNQIGQINGKLDRVQQSLDRIQNTLDQMNLRLVEMANRIGVVDQKLNVALNQLNAIQDEILYLKGYFTGLNLQSTINNFRSILRNFSLTPSQQLASDLIINYDALLQDYILYVLKNYELGKQIQAIAQDIQVSIPITFYKTYSQDASTFTTISDNNTWVTIDENDRSVDTVLNVSIPNPKFYVPLSPGDMEFLIELCLFRFTINSYFINGTQGLTLDQYNRSVANFYLSDIREIRDSLTLAFNSLPKSDFPQVETTIADFLKAVRNSSIVHRFTRRAASVGQQRPLPPADSIWHLQPLQVYGDDNGCNRNVPAYYYAPKPDTTSIMDALRYDNVDWTGHTEDLADSIPISFGSLQAISFRPGLDRGVISPEIYSADLGSVTNGCWQIMAPQNQWRGWDIWRMDYAQGFSAMQPAMPPTGDTLISDNTYLLLEPGPLFPGSDFADLAAALGSPGAPYLELYTEKIGAQTEWSEVGRHVYVVDIRDGLQGAADVRTAFEIYYQSESSELLDVIAKFATLELILESYTIPL